MASPNLSQSPTSIAVSVAIYQPPRKSRAVHVLSLRIRWRQGQYRPSNPQNRAHAFKLDGTRGRVILVERRLVQPRSGGERGSDARHQVWARLRIAAKLRF